MKTYREFRPTGFDAAGLGLPDRQDWLVVPIAVNRDTEDCLTLSNWRVMLRELAEVDPTGQNHEVHRFGHWGPGWFELILVRPGSATAERARVISDGLEEYPVADDSDFSDLEHETACRLWRALSYRERSAILAQAGLDRRLARRVAPPWDDQGSVYEQLLRP
jgi:hypothetical protein